MFTTTITDWESDQDRIRRSRYGVIETKQGKLVAIHLRAWPKVLSLRELWPVGDRYHARGPEDRCLLYYNQPLRSPRFLALKYLVSTSGTSYATACAALEMLDAIAELKQIDALVCDAANSRLSDRLMRRKGWEPHAPMPWRRNFIRRFYGNYPGTLAKI